MRHVNASQFHCQPQFGAIVLWALKQIWEVSVAISGICMREQEKI